jgi:hypothetical protein
MPLVCRNNSAILYRALPDFVMSDSGRFCSLIPGLGVKLSTIILAGPTVLSAVGACPPHDGVR